MIKVLSIGILQEPLKRRNQALRRAGFRVVSAASSGEALRDLAADDFDVAVLGHGLPDHERSAIASGLRRNSPATFVIMLYEASLRRDELADALLMLSEEPQHLVSTIRHFAESKAGPRNAGSHHRRSAPSGYSARS